MYTFNQIPILPLLIHILPLLTYFPCLPVEHILSLHILIINAYKNIKQNTIPINPLTSTNENPINAHLIKLLLTPKLRPKLFNNEPNIIPTPTPTPTNDINGKLEAIKRKPDNIITE